MRCPDCNGIGTWYGNEYEPTEYCDLCDGSGQLPFLRGLQVRFNYWIGQYFVWYWYWCDQPTHEYTDRLMFVRSWQNEE